MERAMSKEVQRWIEMERRIHEEEIAMLEALIEEKRCAEAEIEKQRREGNYTELLEGELLVECPELKSAVEMMRKDGLTDEEIYGVLSLC